MMKLIKSILIMISLILALSSCRSGSSDNMAAVTKVYEGEDGRALFFDTEKKNGNLLLRDENSHFIILYKTDDNTWIVAEKTPYNAGEGRIETEHILLYVPESREIKIENLNPSLSGYGMQLGKKDGTDCLITTYNSEDTYIPLAGLLQGQVSALLGEMPEKKDEVRTEASPIMPGSTFEIALGDGEEQFGRGLSEKVEKSIPFNCPVPSFASFEGHLYVIDAMSFRVMVYDYYGKFVRKIEYPHTGSDGKPLEMTDIAVDKEYIYLVSLNENAVYVVDAETEDVATILKGIDPDNFGTVSRIEIDKIGDLMVLDTKTNTIYGFKREGFTFRLISTFSYKHPGQLVTARDGTIYSVTTSDSSFTVTNNRGSFSNIFKCKFPVVSAEIFATDNDGNVYIRVEEADPMVQYFGPIMVSIISPEGKLSDYIPIAAFPSVKMVRNIVTDNKGYVFEAYFDADFDSEYPPSKFIIKRVK